MRDRREAERERDERALYMKPSVQFPPPRADEFERLLQALEGCEALAGDLGSRALNRRGLSPNQSIDAIDGMDGIDAPTQQSSDTSQERCDHSL